MSGSLAEVAISECLRLAAQARRDLLNVARGWLALVGIVDGELEDGQLKYVAGW